MKTVNPYLNFAGNTEEAFKFYRTVFGGDFAALVRFRDFSDNEMGIAEDELDLIAHVALPLGRDHMLMGTDVPKSMPIDVTIGNNTYIMLGAETEKEATALFDALSEDGDVEMELQRTDWAELYGSFRDRYGVQWMVSYEGDVEFPFGGT